MKQYEIQCGQLDQQQLGNGLKAVAQREALLAAVCESMFSAGLVIDKKVSDR